MRIVILASLAAVAFAKSTPEWDKPVFEITASRSMDEPPSITVSFASGVQDDLMLTHYKMHESSIGGCNYLGRLRNSDSSSVAVTGCLNKPGDRMDITLISDHNTDKMFSVDFFGNTEIVTNPFADGAISRAINIDRADKDFKRLGDEEINLIEEADAETAPAVSIPSKLKAVIKFGYDEGMKNRLGSQDFGTWIESVFTHTQAHYRHPSLGTLIEFEVQGSPIFKSGAYWNADNNLEQARQETRNANLNGVDTMSWWSDYGGGSTAGIAYVGTMCSRSYGTNLNEYQSTHSASGYVLAHELGHNFGMSHDFDEKHGGYGGPCNGKGIMSYGSMSYDQWSSCSRSDWERHYASRRWAMYCLEDTSDHPEKCRFVLGDGIGGTEKRIGKTATEVECADLVRKKEPNANGATWGNEDCFAEFEAVGVNGNEAWRTCLFGDACTKRAATYRCKFPFEYGGVTYSKCTTAGGYDTPWCYSAYDRTWDYCVLCKA